MSSLICWCHVFLGRPRRLVPDTVKCNYSADDIIHISSLDMFKLTKAVTVHNLVLCIIGSSANCESISMNVTLWLQCDTRQGRTGVAWHGEDGYLGADNVCLVHQDTAPTNSSKQGRVKKVGHIYLHTQNIIQHVGYVI